MNITDVVLLSRNTLRLKHLCCVSLCTFILNQEHI